MLVVLFIFALVINDLIILWIRDQMFTKTLGNLVIVDDPDDGPYMFLEIKEGNTVESIRSKSEIRLTVDDRARNNQTL